jgi:hypothetical protein
MPFFVNECNRTGARRQHGSSIREVILVLVPVATVIVAVGVDNDKVVRVARHIRLESDLDRDRMIEVEAAMMRIKVVPVPHEQPAIERQPQFRAGRVRLRLDVHALHDVAVLAAAEAERVVERRQRPLRCQRMERIEEREPAAGLDLAARHDFDAGRNAIVVQLQLGDWRAAAVANHEIHDPQLQCLAAAIRDAKVAVHGLAVERSLQQRLRGHDSDLQGGGRSRGGQQESHHDKLRRQAR